MELNNKRVLIIGMARSGIAAAQVLCDLGCSVIINDAKPADALDGLDMLTGKCEFRLGCRADELIRDIDYIVVSPSVPPGIPALKKAKEMGIPVLTEIELGYRLCKGQTVAITGTNGKTTTTSLVGKMFEDAMRGRFIVGNIGLPYVSRALLATKEDVMVTEISSYQLECIDSFHAHVAALLNITPDHLDRHGDMNNYIAVKKRVFENQTPQDYAVLNYDDETVRAMAQTLKSRVVFFSRKQSLPEGVFLQEDNIVFKHGAVNTIVCPAKELYIQGAHNLENAMAAVAIGLIMGISAKSAAYTLRTFQGVEHRIERVDTVRGITFINDSKGTNPDSTQKAIEAMVQPTVLILGGYDKGGSFDELIASYTDQIRYTVVLGQTKEKIAESLEKQGKDFAMADSFAEAVQMAYTAAQDGWNVLLSPACASWGMFVDFEQRGKVFKEIVLQIKEQD